MRIKDITAAIEDIAPLTYQESYDNCGLQVGDANAEVTGVLLTLDVTEAVVQEALDRNCNLIVAHHPVIFSGLKRLTGKSYVERVVLMAIKNNVAIYAAHTNLDNMRAGVNARIASKLGLINTTILQPKNDTLYKLYTYAPDNVAATVRDVLFAAGAGQIGDYKDCSFSTPGLGTFRPGEGTNPNIGTAGGGMEQVQETKIEVLVERHRQNAVMQALRAAHPYEEVAYELIPLPNPNQQIGAGMVGYLPQPMNETDFLHLLKNNMKTDCIRHTPLPDRPIHKVALCGGSGSFLLNDAIAAGADVFVTGDYKYHQFFDADGRILIADIGHYESEQFTPEIFEDVLTKKFPNFAVLLSNVLTNPVKYFC